MKLSVILLSLFIMFACADSGNEVIVHGILTWDANRHAIVTECNTKKSFKLGVMDSNQYFLLTRKSEELSQNVKLPVVVTVSGNITSSNNLILNQPNILNIYTGGCS